MSLPKNCIKISNSANGKCRAIERKRLLISEDEQQILIVTNRRFFEPDSNDVDGIGAELVSPDFQPYELNLTADNQKICNAANGLLVTSTEVSGSTGTSFVYIDAAGNVANNVLGLYDFFAQFLDEPVSIHQLTNQTIITQDQVYKSWD